MVSAQQHLRHGKAFPYLRAGVLGVFQKAVPMALPDIAHGVRQHSRHQPADRVRNRHGRQLPAGEDKVPEGNLLVHAGVQEALIHALVMAADQHQVVVIPLQAAGRFLVEGGALGREIDHPPAAFPSLIGLRGYRIQAALQGLGHHDAAEAAAVGVVVHLVLPVLGVIANLNAGDVQNSFAAGPSQDALVEHLAHVARKEGQNINFHQRAVHGHIPSISRTVTTPASASAAITKAGTAGIRCSRPSPSVTT